MSKNAAAESEASLLSEKAQAMIDAARQEKANADALLDELSPGSAIPPAPKVYPAYTHEGMVDLIVANPTWTHKQFAAAYGRPASWFATLLATDAFQLVLDGRRSEVTDPSITATLEERVRALTIKSLTVLQGKLESSKVDDLLVMSSLNAGIKALGMGTAKPDGEKKGTPASIASLADKLVDRMRDTGQGRLSAPRADIVDVEVKGG